MQTEILILAGLLLAVLVLQLVLLFRRADNAALENALREEQRNGRGELRGSWTAAGGVVLTALVIAKGAP